METFDAITKRASVREYQKKSIDKPLIEKLVDAGRRAPSARCVEPWEFVAIQEEATLQKLGDMVAPNGSFVKGAGCCIIIFCKETKYYLEDGCAATENILLAAADLGLGACWIAGDKKPYVNDVAKLIGAPQDTKLICLIAIGYPKSRVTQTKNRTLSDVIHWEKF